MIKSLNLVPNLGSLQVFSPLSNFGAPHFSLGNLTTTDLQRDHKRRTQSKWLEIIEICRF